MDTCPITGYPFAWLNNPNFGGRFEMLPPIGTTIVYKFSPIGQVSITMPAVADLVSKVAANSQSSRPWHTALAGICRNHYEEGKPPYEVTVDLVAQLSNGTFGNWYPKSFDEKQDHFLQYLLRRQKDLTPKEPNNG